MGHVTHSVAGRCSAISTNHVRKTPRRPTPGHSRESVPVPRHHLGIGRTTINEQPTTGCSWSTCWFTTQRYPMGYRGGTHRTTTMRRQYFYRNRSTETHETLKISRKKRRRHLKTSLRRVGGRSAYSLARVVSQKYSASVICHACQRPLRRAESAVVSTTGEPLCCRDECRGRFPAAYDNSACGCSREDIETGRADDRGVGV